MLSRFFNHLTAFVILLHCLGVTQLAAAYSNGSAFVNMLSMSEEETKKEKESKDEVDYANDVRCKLKVLNANLLVNDEKIYYSGSKNRINHQFIIERPTPPPDLTA